MQINTPQEIHVNVNFESKKSEEASTPLAEDDLLQSHSPNPVQTMGQHQSFSMLHSGR